MNDTGHLAAKRRPEGRRLAECAQRPSRTERRPGIHADPSTPVHPGPIRVHRCLSAIVPALNPITPNPTKSKHRTTVLGLRDQRAKTVRHLPCPIGKAPLVGRVPLGSPKLPSEGGPRGETSSIPKTDRSHQIQPNQGIAQGPQCPSMCSSTPVHKVLGFHSNRP